MFCQVFLGAFLGGSAPKTLRLPTRKRRQFVKGCVPITVKITPCCRLCQTRGALCVGIAQRTPPPLIGGDDFRKESGAGTF
jgi:hypothetical protein